MEVNGLPLHVLLVHIVVVLVPVAALCAVATAAWPAARRRLGIVTPLLALANMVLVPIVTDAGEWLQQRVPATPLIAQHVALGLTLYPWTIAVFVFAALQWAWFFFVDRAGSPRRPSIVVRRIVLIALIVVSVGLAIGSIVDVVLIGEAGSRAIWQNSFSPTPLPTTTP
ncbi:hypothetical protein [Leifsonia poae]|uniref:hypothetical protein n=1 Tax=Leifsonia poae TaxID=110933 RepID=UPI001CBF6202|nr:hypothetical protein [Leifsonia poae]